MRESLDSIALHVGYVSLGLSELAEGTRERAHNQRLFLSGVDRMARPLGEATVRGLQVLRELDDVFDGVASKVDSAVAAQQATYPPTDWVAYSKEEKRKMREEKAGWV
ncbi:hypothetical protein ACFXPW_27930 [Streptomyces goshikiensis]|uniref:hypothetical protein n=2 Tax=Streptomyces goshikiensis TaxID=1942 RepID=UPI0036A7D6B1